MKVKNLLDPSVQQQVIERINNLSPQSKSLWGKMNVGQMLTHVQRVMAVAYGTFQLKTNFLLKLIGPFLKSGLYNEKPYKHGLPTHKSYVVTDEKNFANEREKLIEMIEGFSEQAIVNTQHPVFGSMTKEEWGKSLWKHLDHHLQQFGA
ncbi:MAG: DUF1569 domain-containing protein [Ginsengibacter sp.]